MNLCMKALGVISLVIMLGSWAVSPALADIEFFGTAKVKPTLYSNFDFDDSKPDAPVLNEGGWASGEHVRSELRLGWKATGENWRVKMIAEADIINSKDNADRSFYVGATKENQPNTGGEFGIERAEMGYSFCKALDLSAGWDIRFLDIKSGGLLFGDDHPFIGLKGALGDNTKYELLYLAIENIDIIGGADSPNTGDWRAYSLKIDQAFDLGNVGNLTVSPLFAFSDNEHQNAAISYYGLESLGKIGPVNTSFEIIAADGEFNTAAEKDISSWAMFAGLELPVNDNFTPYVAYRFTQGDGNASDNEVEGFVGITDIGRFTPLMGMDGNILGEHLSSGASIYNAPLYSFSPERAVGGDNYGGIGNGGSGNNPGEKIIAVGAKGALLPKLGYKAQAFFIWYDDTANLANIVNPGQAVDDYAGTTFDLQLKYAFNKNFAIDNIFSTFVPGDGIQDQVNADDNAYLNMLTLAWTY
ncbi:MAG TPA: hypothetical protein VJ995_09700 [Geothermobacteraceae bacterium]|nr:hypothetical protein [Geothermobacteraceae bacterium]